MSLADVYEDYRCDQSFDKLRIDGIVLVPGEGSSRPKVFIVGEAPGALENTQRRPFVGVSGVALRSLIRDCARLESEDYFITNTVKYRPPNNRTPEWYEIDASRPYLRREYAALGSPAILVAVGGTAREALAPHIQGGVLAHAGKPYPLGQDRTLWPMIHPRWAIGDVNRQRTLEEHWVKFGEWFRGES
jgi:DNA polymerase